MTAYHHQTVSEKTEHNGGVNLILMTHFDISVVIGKIIFICYRINKSQKLRLIFTFPKVQWLFCDAVMPIS